MIFSLMPAVTLWCSWPASVLSPNSRAHWAKKAKAKKLQREEARVVALAAGCNRRTWAERIPVTISFQPPDKRKRDTDNMLASFKAGIDGIADAMAVDDSRFEITLKRLPPVTGRGRVVVTVEHA